jgi:hypothetical protein
VIKFPNDYTPEALSAAEAELASRQISEEELEAAHKAVDERVAIEHVKKQLKRDRTDAITQTLDGVAMELMPGNAKWRHPERAILVITVLSILLVIIGVASDIPMIRYAFYVGIIESGYAPILVMYAVWLAAAILFYARYKFAWYALMLLNMFALISMCANLIVYQLGPMPLHVYEDRSETNAKSLFGLLFFGSQLYVILRPEMLEIFNINPRIKNILISVSVAIGVLVAGIALFWL